MTPPPLAAAPPWIAPIEQALRLATAGVMILVDQAGPGVLPVLLRRLLPLYPDLEVLFSAVQLGTVAEGSVVILCPDPSEAAWLNLNRPLLSQRALRVILFCDTETAIALNRQAPDFFDWISRRVVAPTVAPPHAVAGLRGRYAGRDDLGRLALAHRPGVLAGLAGMDPKALDCCAQLLERGVAEEELIATLQEAEDLRTWWSQKLEPGTRSAESPRGGALKGALRQSDQSEELHARQLLLLAETLFSQGRYDEAAQVLAQSGSKGLSLVLQARLDLRQGQRERARALWDRCCAALAGSAAAPTPEHSGALWVNTDGPGLDTALQIVQALLEVRKGGSGAWTWQVLEHRAALTPPRLLHVVPDPDGPLLFHPGEPGRWDAKLRLVVLHARTPPDRHWLARLGSFGARLVLHVPLGDEALVRRALRDLYRALGEERPLQAAQRVVALSKQRGTAQEDQPRLYLPIGVPLRS